jgi:hypothetical protein
MNLLTKINGFKVDGFTFFPFVFIRKEASKFLVNHEKIHLRQHLEMLIIFFYLIYGVHYLVLRFKNKHKDAYRKICFEQEAYTNQSNLEYLKTRKLYAWSKNND